MGCKPIREGTVAPEYLLRVRDAQSTDLQGVDQLPVLLAREEQRCDPSIRELEHGLPELRGLTRGFIAEENSHLPHQESIPHPLKRVSGHEGHGSFQALLLGRQSHLEVLDLVLENGLLLGVSKADLRGDLIVVGDHGHAGPPRAVALGDGQVVHDLQDHIPHPAEGVLGDPLGGVQGEGQLRREDGAFQGPCGKGEGFHRQTTSWKRGLLLSSEGSPITEMTYRSSKLEENREESESLVHRVRISHIRIKMRNRRQKIVYLRHLSLMLWTRAHCWKGKKM